LSTQLDPATASLQSDIAGDLRKLAVKTNIASGVTLAVSGRLGSAEITGNVDGARLSALGFLAPASAAEALAIGSLTIGGNVTGTQLLAGYDRTGSAANADASIGRVLIRGNWTASNLVAGASAGPDGLFGTEDDALIAGGNSVVARIASVLIKRSVNGTEVEADHFGFVAEQIVAFKAGGVKAALLSGASNDTTGVAVGSSGRVRVREVA